MSNIQYGVASVQYAQNINEVVFVTLNKSLTVISCICEGDHS